MSPRRRTLTHGLLAAALFGQRAAQALEAPTGPVTLTLSGRLRWTNQAERALFDMAMLEQLPQRDIHPPTPWYAAPRKFTGPLLRDVLGAAGAHGKLLRAIALNDYRVDIPFDDTQRYDIVLARLLDDKPMAVRDKGPLFIMYPFDSRPELRNTVYFSRCAWQLKAIDIQ